MAKMTMAQALNLTLTQEMAKDDRVIVLGKDVSRDGVCSASQMGSSKRTVRIALSTRRWVRLALGWLSEWPCMGETGSQSPVLGLHLSGLSPHQQHAACVGAREADTVPMVIRAPFAAGVRALEHHSESREAYFAHTPGLKMVIPSGPRNARALLLSAIRDPDPVIFFEPKSIYRAFREEVPEEEETMEIGKSVIAREGKDLTMISYGAMMRPTLAAAEKLAEEDGVQAEVIDLLSLSPLDDTLFTASARKTGRVVIVHEAHRSFGPGAEIASRIMEQSFWMLEAPIKRVTGFDIVVPLFAREQAYLPNPERVLRAARETLSV